VGGGWVEPARGTSGLFLRRYAEPSTQAAPASPESLRQHVSLIEFHRVLSLARGTTVGRLCGAIITALYGS
jgi:hypothetical protein